MSGPFGAKTTTDEVLAGMNLRGKRILVTGASAGLGVETARALAAHGAQVVGAARDLAKAHAATQVVRDQAAGGGSLELIELDLADLASVRACADGFETQFGTNHLGHFVLINRLSPLLKAGSRVVVLSSSGHRFSDVNLQDPNFETSEYTPFGAYGRSKTANALFAVEFDRRHRDRGVRATAVHPGGIQTELGRHMTPEATTQMIAQINTANQRSGAAPFEFKSIPQGAATSVWAAVAADADEVGGRYCEDCHVAQTVDGDEFSRGGVRPYAVDPDNAKALWAKSEEMVGERF